MEKEMLIKLGISFVAMYVLMYTMIDGLMVRNTLIAASILLTVLLVLAIRHQTAVGDLQFLRP